MGCSWRFWRGAFTGTCYLCIMSITITASIVAPIFAIAGPTLGLSTQQVATVFSVYYLPNIGSSLAAGVLASLYGRRRVLSVGCATLSAGCVALGLVPTACGGEAAEPSCLYGLFIASRVLQGIGCALAQTCLFAMLGDMWPADTGKVMGAAELMGGVSYAIGPPVGGFLYTTRGFRTPFVAQGAMPLCFVIVLQLVLSQYNRARGPNSTEREEDSPAAQSDDASADEGDEKARLTDPQQQSPQVGAGDDSGSEGAGATAASEPGSGGGVGALLRMWCSMLSPGMLLTAITAGIEQGAWGHYQLSNPPFLQAAFGTHTATTPTRLITPCQS